MVKRQAMETLSILLVVLLELLIRTESIPVDLQDAMGKATSVETFLALLNVSDAPNKNRESLRNRVNEVPLVMENELCKPIEVMVQIQQPKKKRALYFPMYVKLYRCRGGCNVEPRLYKCARTGQKTITIKVGYVAWKKGEEHLSKLKKRVKILHLVNETQCGCACKNTRKCNPRTQLWNPKTCRCDNECDHCAPPYWCNNVTRQCECPRFHHCHDPGKVWSREQCQCVCHASLSCSAGHYMNPKTCRCNCHRGWCNLEAIVKTRHSDEDTIELAKSETQPLQAL